MNVNKYRPRGPTWRQHVNIRNPLIALLGWDKLGSDCKINSSDYFINSILLSKQQVAQMCNFGRKQ